MELKYNEIIGAIVKPDDTPATQAEILQWAKLNPMPIEEESSKKEEILKYSEFKIILRKSQNSCNIERGKSH